MNVCEETFQSLKKQNVLILEKSAVQNCKEGSGSQIEAFMLNKGNQIILKNIIFSGEKRFGLETTRKPANFYKEIYSSNKGEERKQSTSLRITKSQSHFLEENLQNGIENKAINICEEGDSLVQNGQQELIQMKSTKEKTSPKKRSRENGEDVASVSEESVATKKILFKTEEEFCMKNPYLEFILKSENSNPRLCVTGNSEELHTNSSVSERESRTDEKSNKRGVDIFGNNLTDKDRNKIKVNCPHCTKKVSAPGFVRHLSYCMKACVRKSKRRS